MPNCIKTPLKNMGRTLLAAGTLLLSNIAVAADGPKPDAMSNPLSIMMVIIMIILLLIIALLANLLLGAAGFYSEKIKGEEKKGSGAPVASAIAAGLLLISVPSLAQTTATNTAASTSIGGLSATTFYLMAAVIFLEIIVILGLLLNLRILIAKEKKRKAIEAAPVKVKPALSWWDRFNKLRPIKEEADMDLGHDYDGIRELDNRLPPWWLYGFYVTIIFAGVYLWRYHVSHTAPSSEEEYQMAVAKAEKQKEDFLKKSAANVDENTVSFIKDAGELSAGQQVFQTNCAPCHGKAGEGNIVGPNLTDEYWLHGGGIKDIFKTIKYGVPEKGMKSWKDDFSPKQLAQLASYIKSIQGSNPPNAKEKQGELYKEGAVVDSTSKVVASTAVNN